MNEIVDLALFFTFFPAVQSTRELASLYLADVELQRLAIEAWNVLSEMNLLGKMTARNLKQIWTISR